MTERDGLSWDRLLSVVRSSHPQLYRTWFESLRATDISGGLLRIVVRDPAQAQYLRTECSGAFTQAAMTVTGHLVSVQFVVAGDGGDHEAAHVTPPALTKVPLNPDYTFDDFVVGPSNRLAHAACRAVCNQPGTLYNPLFVHGFSGLGKSHVLQATCDAMLRANPHAEVAYISCETFVNDYVRAIEAGYLPAFRNDARRCDLLVIDDVQFLANRESSQEELFHTFNTLYQARKQIILSADSPPTKIPTLEDRLVSRFSWGLVAQIDPPTRETRQAILQKKAKMRGVDVPPEVLDYVAQHIAGNIRALEGALNTLLSRAKFEEKALTLEMARTVLPVYEATEPRSIQIAEILQVVARHYGLRLPDLLGRKRTRSVSHPRQVAMYLARRLTPLSLEEIGAHFGGRDHSTVVHAEQTIVEEAAGDPRVADLLDHLEKRLVTK